MKKRVFIVKEEKIDLIGQREKVISFVKMKKRGFIVKEKKRVFIGQREKESFHRSCKER